MLKEFSYTSPRTREELFALLKDHQEKAKLLAGGTDLLVDIRADLVLPEVVIDLKSIGEYHRLAFDDKNGLSIGAAVRYIDLLELGTIKNKYPLLVEAAKEVGSPPLRNRATMAGNLCTASPAGDMAPALLCLGARVEISSSSGSRQIALRDFFTGVKRTVLKSDEVLERIMVPPEMAGGSGGIEKLKRIKGHDLSLVNVAMFKKGDLLRVAIGSCGVTPLVLEDFAATAKVEEVEEEAVRVIKPIDDLRASAHYRIFMVRAFIRKLMERVA